MKTYIINYIRIDGYKNTVTAIGTEQLIDVLRDLKREDEGIVIEIFTSNL